ncbi:hypothetical protein HGM15179_017573 [Zosterops borbonicus]|uniref:Uncharacterized protein n=1 Tax=Zosterops borbonicus TaxID=364589 RepID=A0A8K1G0N2_9PASS|nr:hypothetical protein HGM15179_017573 [Zosterops borbonicus]
MGEVRPATKPCPLLSRCQGRPRQRQDTDTSTQDPLDGIPSFKDVNFTTQLDVFFRVAENALNLFVHVIDGDIKQYWSKYGPLRDTTFHWELTIHQDIDLLTISLWMRSSRLFFLHKRDMYRA